MPNLLNRLRLDLYEILLDSGTWSDDEVARDRLLSALVERLLPLASVLVERDSSGNWRAISRPNLCGWLLHWDAMIRARPSPASPGDLWDLAPPSAFWTTMADSESLPKGVLHIGVDQAVVSPAAISITAMAPWRSRPNCSGLDEAA